MHNLLINLIVSVSFLLSAVFPLGIATANLSVSTSGETRVVETIKQDVVSHQDVSPTPEATKEEKIESTPAPETEIISQDEPVSIAPQGQDLKLNISANPPLVKEGQPLQIQWSVEGADFSSNEWTLAVKIPQEFRPEKEWTMNTDSGIYSLPLQQNAGNITLDTGKGGEDFSLISVQLLNKGVVWQEESIYVGKPTRVYPDAETAVRGIAGQIELKFPKGAVSSELDAVILPLTEKEKQQSGAGKYSFKLEAYDEKSLQVTKFAAPYQLIIRYDENDFFENESSLKLDYLNEENNEWVPVPNGVDRDNNYVSAYLDHMSIYNLNADNFQSALMPTLNGYQVSELTGAAAYSYPIEVPAGPAGLQPSIGLSYNSQAVDGVNGYTQASWVGMGWSLDMPHIFRDTRGTMDNFDDDIFSLTLNGVSYPLLKDDTSNTGFVTYHTQNETFYRIQAYGSLDAANSTWKVWDTQGNLYEFGASSPNNEDNLYSSIMAYGVCATTDDDLNFLTYRWSIRQMTNTSGQQILYNYVEDRKLTDSDCNGWGNEPWDTHYDRSVVPASIVYDNNHYRVVFNRSNDRLDYRESWSQPLRDYLYTTSRLTSIQIDHNPDGDAAFADSTLISRYSFTYAGLDGNTSSTIFPNWGLRGSDPLGKTLTLVNIIQKGYIDGVESSLPVNEFYYEDGMHLTRATNGYGGGVEFTYDNWYPWQNEGYNWTHLAVTDNYKLHPTPEEMEQDGKKYLYQPDNWIISGSYDQNTQTRNIEIGTPNVYPGSAYELNVYLWMDSSTPTYVTFGMDANGDYTASSNWDEKMDYSHPVATVAAGQNFVTLEDVVTLPSLSLTYDSVKYWVRCQVSDSNGANKSCGIKFYQIRRLPTYYRVTSKTITDEATDLESTFSYSYEHPSVNNEAESCVDGNDMCHWTEQDINKLYEAPYTVFRGHHSVTVTGPDGEVQKTIYHQKAIPSTTDLSDPDIVNKDTVLTGYPAQTILMVPDPLRTYQTTTIEYATDAPVAKDPAYLPDSGLQMTWIRKTSETTQTYDLSNASSWTGVRTTYAYNTASQGGTQYGNLTHTTQFKSDGGDYLYYRRSFLEFHPQVDATRYLVSYPAVNASYRCADDGLTCTMDWSTMTSLDLFLYDDNTTHSASPTEGKMTRVRKLISGTSDSNAVYSDQKIEYDVWGNVNKQYAYTGTGTTSTFASAGEQVASYCYGIFNWNSGVCDETSGYGTLLTGTKNNLNHKTAITNNYANGQVMQLTDPNGAVTTASYDAFGRLLSVRKPGDESGIATLAIGYYNPYLDQATNLWQPFMIDIQQKIDSGPTYNIRRFYDGLGQMIQTQTLAVVNGASKDVVVDTKYDAYGRVIEQTVPHDETSWYNGMAGRPTPYLPQTFTQAKTLTSYDPLGRPSLVTGTDGSQVSYAYGLNTASVTDANGNTTSSETDVFGRTIRVTPPTGPDVAYTYDTRDQLLNAVTGGNTTTLTYDKLGRKTQMSDPDMGTWYYWYDGLSNLKAQKDARNLVVCLAYDSLNRVIEKKYSSTYTCSSGTVQATYGYDGTGSYTLGQRTSMSDLSGGSSAWTYDIRGRMTSETKTIANSGTFLTQWAYNSADLPTSITYPGGDNGQAGEVVNTTYYRQMAVKDVIGSYTYLKVANYNAAGQILTRYLGNDSGTYKVKTTYAYNPWTGDPNQTETNGGGMINSITSGIVGDADALQSLQYQYDANGNVLSINDAYDVNKTFGYDSLNRLTDYQTETYTYDEVGRLETAPAGGTLVYSTTHPHAVASVTNGGTGTGTYLYDNNGNQTRRTIGNDIYNLYYNHENKLTSVTKNGTTIAAFTYDGDGKRVRSVIGADATAYVNALEWKESTADTIMTKYYFAGTSRIAMRVWNITERLEAKTGLTFLLTDHLGSSTAAWNVQAETTTRQAYDPWGRTTSTSSLATPYQYTGQRLETSFNLYDYGGTRYYDPATGHFTQADTIIPGAGNPAAWDHYAYVLNNPLRYTDPSGYFTEEEISGYLKQRYTGTWEQILAAWKSDELFWTMLLGAQVGDTLYAPLSGLSSATFGAGCGGGFTFDGDLRSYQGKGPYRLEYTDKVSGTQRRGRDVGGNLDKQSVMYKNEAFFSTDTVPYSQSENFALQPIYDYSSSIPKFTGQYNWVGLRHKWSPDILGGSGVPFLASGGAKVITTLMVFEGSTNPVVYFLSGPFSSTILIISAVNYVNGGLLRQQNTGEPYSEPFNEDIWIGGKPNIPDELR